MKSLKSRIGLLAIVLKCVSRPDFNQNSSRAFSIGAIILCGQFFLCGLAYTQQAGQPVFGGGTITEMKRYVNGIESHEYNPGDDIWVAARATAWNNVNDWVTFTLSAHIHVDDEEHVQHNQQVDSDADSVEIGPVVPPAESDPA